MHREKSVLFISGLQCSGKSYLHGLLRNSPQVFTIPWGIHYFISYYKYDFSEMGDGSIVDYWCNYFQAIQNVDVPESQKICLNPISTELDLKIFKRILLVNLKEKSNKIKDLFFALHYSYAEASGIDLNKIKYIGYEHTLFVPFEKSLEFFNNYKIIQLTKNMPDLFESIINRRVVKSSDINFESFINKLVNSYELSADMDHKANSKLKYVRLEDLLKNKKQVLQKICNWLEIRYDTRIEESSLSGYPFTQKKIVPRKKYNILKVLANTVFKEDQIKFGYLRETERKNNYEKYYFLSPLPNELFIAKYSNSKYNNKILKSLHYFYMNFRVFIRKLPKYISSRYNFYNIYVAKEVYFHGRNKSGTKKL